MAKKTMSQQFEEAAKHDGPPIPEKCPASVALDSMPSTEGYELLCCYIVAFGLKCGVEPDLVELFATELNEFYMTQPFPPAAAGLEQLRRKFGEPFPDHDLRRVQLMLELFATTVRGHNAIEREDDEAELRRIAAEKAKQPRPFREGEGAMRAADDPFGPSDLAKSLHPRG